jgi:hypothetical protein
MRCTVRESVVVSRNGAFTFAAELLRHANCLLSVTDHCLRSRNYVNLVVAGKQPAPQWLTMDEAIRHCTAGLGIWEWASNDRDSVPDVVMACCGDVLLRLHALEVFVNRPKLVAAGPKGSTRGVFQRGDRGFGLRAGIDQIFSQSTNDTIAASINLGNSV